MSSSTAPQADYWKSKALRLVGIVEQMELLLEQQMFKERSLIERKVLLSMLFNDEKSDIFKNLKK
jgi:hypothetical protein